MGHRCSMRNDGLVTIQGLIPDRLFSEGSHPVVPLKGTQVLPLPIQGAKRRKTESVARKHKGGTKASW